MNIKRVEVFGIRLALKKPFIVSYDRYDDMPTIITRLETENGTVGWGEAVPDQHVTGETWESTFQIIKHELAPLVINENPFNINLIHKKMNDKIKDVPSAKAAIDIAFYDLMGKLSNQPVYRLIGGRAHKKLDIPQVISILPPEEMALQAKQIVEEGFNNIKIKVGTDPRTDIGRIRAVRDAIPNSMKLRVDANQGWNTSGAIHVIENTKDCNVEWYEQPIKAGNHESMAEIRMATHVNIMADESIHSAQDLLSLIQLRGADLVNIKLMKAGGIYPAIALANLAETAGMQCQVGSMVESAIATMAGAHLSLSQSIIKSNEMVGPLMFKEDLAETHYHNGLIEVSDSPGLGVNVNEDLVREKAVLYCSV
ncbi:dipeptide epimerase [Virgibacillus profundi]|uniref:Dipeptide epimerase n=1 Tax=Virgibacillus profundi TaxID=2024555 RepID=A0A2A2II20_9BACI|nr:dipeptide epimerase [Virgibacillus profundi]PAV30790.1 dipeptide epimerase [Virgibacillus profundi]PXY54973.1 dipeptide epimerase [Virgibacillus profundi]